MFSVHPPRADHVAPSPDSRGVRRGARRLAAAALITGLAVSSATAQDATQLMEQVGASFDALESYERQLDMTMDIEVAGQTSKQVMSAKEQVVPPGKHRSEVTMMGVTFLTVSDGETTWTYNPMVKQYTEQTAASIDGGPKTAGMSITESQLAGATKGATITYTEALTVGDREIECHVVTIDPSAIPPQPGVTLDGVRLWLSESSPFILKLETRVRDIPTPMGAAKGVITNTLASFSVDEPIDDGVFAFEAPDGAEKVEEFASQGPATPKSPLEGKPAPDFTGTTLAGETVTLSALRGKVVLVDFWATWCGPCRMELPHIQKLRDEHGGELEILAVSNEKLGTIQRYVEAKGYTFTTVHDPSRSISGLYGVSSLPTVVIVDGEGTVTSHLIGLRSEEALRGALADAGLGK